MVNSICAFEETLSSKCLGKRQQSWRSGFAVLLKSETIFNARVTTVGGILHVFPPALQTYLSQSSTSHSSLTKDRE